MSLTDFTPYLLRKHIFTLSLGSRLMVLRGRSTRSTLSDLMVLMSFPLVPLLKSSRGAEN